MSDPTPPPALDPKSGEISGGAAEGSVVEPGPSQGGSEIMTEAIEKAADDVFGSRRGLADRYVTLLANEGIAWGLIGPREHDRLWDRHVLNSVAVQSLIPQGVDVLDVGSGAGLPGIPLALARPDLRIWLLEPLQRRVDYLDLVVDELGLQEQVTVIRGRAEDYRGETFDVVTCRAVAGLSKLLGWCWPLVGMELLAVKGASAPVEVAKAEAQLSKRKLTAEVLSVRAHLWSEPTTVIRVRRQVDI